MKELIDLALVGVRRLKLTRLLDEEEVLVQQTGDAVQLYTYSVGRLHDRQMSSSLRIFRDQQAGKRKSKRNADENRAGIATHPLRSPSPAKNGPQ